MGILNWKKPKSSSSFSGVETEYNYAGSTPEQRDAINRSITSSTGFQPATDLAALPVGRLGLTGGQTSFGATSSVGTPQEQLSLNTERAARRKIEADEIVQREQERRGQVSQEDFSAEAGTTLDDGTQPPSKVKEEKKPKNEIVFINPETQQEVTRTNPSAGEISSFQKMGFEVATATSDEPIELSADPQVAQFQIQQQNMEQELNSFVQELNRFMVTDSDLRSQARSINNTYKSRINDMKDVNKRREQSMRTLGVRLGSRWTGGMGGVFGGIIAAEERAGLQRIGALEAERDAAILDAETAADERNWNVYVQKSKLIESAQSAKRSLLSEMQKAAQKKNEEIQQQKRTASVEASIAGIYQQGVTNPAAIHDMINFTEDGQMVGDVTFEEIEATLDAIERTKETEKQTNDMLEYNFAQQQGFGGSFLDYIYAKGAAGRAPQQSDPIGDLTDALRLQLLQQQVEQGKEGKPPSSNQLILGGYATRIEQAEPTLSNLESIVKDMNPLTFQAQIFADHPALQSKEIEQYVQASRNLINSILRRESGAVISPTEFSEARKQYLPVAGDSDEVLRQKANNRKAVLETYKRGAGNAYVPLDELLGTTSNNLLQGPQQASGDVRVISPDGVEGTVPAEDLQEALSEGYTQA